MCVFLAVSQAAALSDCNCLQIVAQPFYGAKLRYRSDYEMNENRLGVLKNKTRNSSYQGPAIRVSLSHYFRPRKDLFDQIPERYLHPGAGHSIRVSLVTTEYHQTNLHYSHPYELEHPSSEELNDRQSNAVWFPIAEEDCVTGIKR